MALDGLDDDAADRMSKHYDNFDKIIPHFLPEARRTNIVLEDLETGKVPTQWQQNMEDSIRLALENTIGKTVNDHGQRGVLNSSVTNQALYDIERNAADEVARQYLANIHEIAGMAEQRWKNTEDALNDMKNSYNEQLGGYLNGIGQRGQIKQNEFNNLNTALVNQGNTFNSQFGNASNALNQQSQLEETSHNNLTGAYLNQGNTFNSQFQNALNALMQRSHFYRLFFAKNKLTCIYLCAKLKPLKISNNTRIRKPIFGYSNRFRVYGQALAEAIFFDKCCENYH